MANKIRQAYEQGVRIRENIWDENLWIKKYSNTKSIDEMGRIWDNKWDFETNQEDWEIWAEDEDILKNKKTNTLPETLIINGIKYKRDDN